MCHFPPPYDKLSELLLDELLDDDELLELLDELDELLLELEDDDELDDLELDELELELDELELLEDEDEDELELDNDELDELEDDELDELDDEKLSTCSPCILYKEKYVVVFTVPSAASNTNAASHFDIILSSQSTNDV